MYSELHVKTNFSFLEGASHANELVGRAAELGYTALAVTDRNSLAGVVRAHGAAKEAGLKLIIGAEITPADAPPLVLWAPDRAAYGRLARLITQGRRRGEKGQCRLTLDDVAAHAEGLLAGVVGSGQWSVVSGQEIVGRVGQARALDADSANSSCRERRPTTQRRWAGARDNGDSQSPNRSRELVPPSNLPTTNYQLPTSPATLAALRTYRELFGERCYLLAELHRGPDDRRLAEHLTQLSRQARLPLLAAGDVHYHVPGRGPLHDVLTAIRHNSTVDDVREHLFANYQRHLKPLEEIRPLFAWAPDAVRRTVEVADRCRFSLDELRYEYPEELAPPGLSPMAYLTQLTRAGAGKRYPQGVPEKVEQLLEHEQRLIEELHYEAYFLTVWDLVRFARGRGILCQGRGSAANSAVCYCLGVTSVNPERMDVLFERFISRERNEAPDIDVDFEHERREEVLQYLYEKYSRDRAGMTAEVITYRPRSAVRDAGKALGLPPEKIDALAKTLERLHDEPEPNERCRELDQRCREVGLDPRERRVQLLVAAAGTLTGFPRHLSQHTGGMVMTRGPLCELVPIENAAMPDRTVIQWNKDDLDELGILKVDCLALGMLTAIRKTFDLVRQHTGRRLTLAGIPEGDQQVYAMIRRADTMGVFQIESRAQMSMLPRLRPRSFYDLVIEVAIVRPGPIQGDMVHPYLRRRNGDEPVTYPSDAIRAVLEKTLGVPLFQEQAMRLAVVAAGFTPGEADQLRRAMAAWRRPGLIDDFRRRLLDGMQARGLSLPYAEAVFQQIRGFGSYGFPESHAASFALLVYVSAWLKCHALAAFTAALVNSQPMGFYAPAQLIRNARDHGVEVRPVDVNASQWDCTLEKTMLNAECGMLNEADGNTSAPSSFSIQHSAFSIRLGFRLLAGMPQAQAEQIVAARAEGPFRSVDDLARRSGLSRAALARLAKAGACGSLEPDRRGALWHALGQDQKPLPLFDRLDAAPQEQAPAQLPRMSEAEEVLADYRTAGLSLRAHPLSFLRQELEKMQAVPAADLAVLRNGGPVRVAGIVLVRQRPGTAKGITFVTLEDETGQANLIIRPDVWAKFRTAARGATLMLVHGRLQREGRVIHVLVTKIVDLSQRLRPLGSQARDFR